MRAVGVFPGRREAALVSRPEPRAQLIASFGATYVSSQSANPAQLAQRMGKIDLVYEAVGLASLRFDVAQHLAPNAAFVLTGVPAIKGPISIDADKLMRNMVLKNQVLLGSVKLRPGRLRGRHPGPGRVHAALAASGAAAHQRPLPAGGPPRPAAGLAAGDQERHQLRPAELDAWTNHTGPEGGSPPVAASLADLSVAPAPGVSAGRPATGLGWCS